MGSLSGQFFFTFFVKLFLALLLLCVTYRMMWRLKVAYVNH